MKISQLIALLENKKISYGDINVKTVNSETFETCDLEAESISFTRDVKDEIYDTRHKYEEWLSIWM